jgi:hypothetical protein
MSIILMEEVVMGLDEVKASLDQAVMILKDLTDDLDPRLGEDLKGDLDITLLQPLRSRATALERLLEELASEL